MTLFEEPKPVLFTPRDYQVDGIGHGVDFLMSKKAHKGGAIEVMPTGSGKSLVIGGIVDKLDDATLVLQPSKEILEQNHAKIESFGYKAGIYSASLGKRQIEKITLATIGSIISRKEMFGAFKHIIIDECHLVNPKGGMYNDFIKFAEKSGVLGLTATPYRLSSDSMGAQLKFITRTRPRIFKNVVYGVQIGRLYEQGWLAKLRYFSIPAIDRSKLQKNTTGADYTDRSLKMVMESGGFNDKLADTVHRLMKKGRRGILVFTSLRSESDALCRRLPYVVQVTGETPSKERDRILADFKAGIIKCVVNVGVLTTGFDYPELDTVVVARPTMSLALWYQMVGRILRPHFTKEEGWVIDMADNMRIFGKVEDLKLRYNNGLWTVNTGNRELTNTYFE